MSFTLDNVVPWGRSMDEYIAMFSLSEQDRASRILGCGDGPASFNAEMSALGNSIVSIDPLYQFSAEEIRRQIDKTYSRVIQELRANRNDYVWTHLSSPEAVGELRLRAMNKFLLDFPKGKAEGRYLAAELPALPFKERTFDLALCSHFLFLYSKHLSPEFHRQAIQEMLRVAKQVRIFPVLTLGGKPSPHLDPVCRHLQKVGRTADAVTVHYEFQRGGNRMLIVR